MQCIVDCQSVYISHTPFSTKHGVKGTEFDNVLVVLGRGWNLYNWDQLLTWLHKTCLANRIGALERNRNLFYVACSRPKSNLTVLITQHLSDESLALLIIVTQGPLEN
ncbi:TPA: 3'-5' exonuclease [Vibrio parahaemolyticus]